MATAALTSKGQITVPKDVREHLGLTAGTRVTFSRNADGDYVLSVRHRRALDLLGSLGYDGAPKSLEDMDEAIAAAAAETMR